MNAVQEMIDTFDLDGYMAKMDGAAPLGARFLDMRGSAWIDVQDTGRLDLSSAGRCVLGYIATALQADKRYVTPPSYSSFVYNPQFDKADPEQFVDGCTNPGFAASLVMTVTQSQNRGFTLPAGCVEEINKMHDTVREDEGYSNELSDHLHQQIKALEDELWQYLSDLWREEISARRQAAEEREKEQIEENLLAELERVTIEHQQRNRRAA